MRDPSPSPDPSDEALIARVAEGNVDAFALLYDRYARAVYVLAVYMVGESEAEEIAQEVFMRLWRRSAQYDPQRGSFVAWFMMLARNHIRDAYRKEINQRRMFTMEDIDTLFADGADSPDRVIALKCAPS